MKKVNLLMKMIIALMITVCFSQEARSDFRMSNIIGQGVQDPPMIFMPNVKANDPNVFPSITLDGSYVNPPESATGTFDKYDTDQTLIWSVARTDINAACDAWTPMFWADSVDNGYFVWLIDEGTTPDTYYLARLAESDGAVTNLGTCQPGDGLFGSSPAKSYQKRASMGAGDLFIRYGQNSITLSSTNGSIVSGPSIVTHNGIEIASTCGYQTDDALIYVRNGPYFVTAYNAISLNLFYDNVPVNLLFPVKIGRLMPSLDSTLSPHLWLGKIYLGITMDTTSANTYSGRATEVLDFNNWLTDIVAANGGE